MREFRTKYSCVGAHGYATNCTQTTHIDDEAEVDKISNEKMKNDNKRLLLCLNDEKYEEMECFVKELTQKKLVGIQLNSRVNGDSERDAVISKLQKIVATTRACSALKSSDRMNIVRLQLGSLVFIFA